MNTNIADFKLSYDKVDNSNLLSLKIRVSHNKLRKRFAFPFKEPIHVSKENLDKLIKYHQTQNQRTSENIRILYDTISPTLQRVQEVIDNLNPFSFEKFKIRFYDETEISKDNSLLTIASITAAEHFENGKITTAQLYNLSAKSIQEFASQLLHKDCNRFEIDKLNRVIRLEHISESFLEAYERWMIFEKKNSNSTVGIYLRNIRAIFNEEISKKNIDADLYPFGKKRYVIPSSNNVKKAIPKENIIKLLNYEHEIASGYQQRSKDFYTFSYLSNGMNIADILKLKWSDIDFENRKISFIRQKTKDTTKNQQLTITVQMFDETIKIIERWGGKSRLSNEFVFPFYNLQMSAFDRKRTKNQFIKSTNYHMRKIAKSLGVEDDPVTMSARHSFATIMMQSNSPIAMISKLLGHTDIKTTQNYLGSFEDEQTKGFLSNLL
jgi:integrase